MKEKIKKINQKGKKYFKRVKEEHLIKKAFQENSLFYLFVLVCVINSTMLRFFTMHTLENYLAIKPIIADLGIVILLGSFSYLFKGKKRYTYLLVCSIFFTAICMINSIYYTFYTSFASASMLSLAQFIAPVGDAVVENVLQLKDLLYIIPVLIFIFYYHRLKKKGKIESYGKKERKTKWLHTMIAGAITMVVFVFTLSSLEVGRFIKQWNREYIVMRFGIYLYQGNDVIKSLQPKISAMFGYDEAKRKFDDYFKEKSDERDYTNEYTGILENKNIIVIHAESFQSVALDRSFNGVEVTPNMNKLIKESLYFSNFYSQVSVGTSSDTELTFNTSLMPTQNGTAFVSYFDRVYNGTPKFMKEKGYYTFSMHANNADFWNRRAMHESLGYDKFYSKETYKTKGEETIGLGLSDKSFFRQSVEKMKKIKEDHDKFYGLLISLSNHTPFSDVEKYGEFKVTMNEEVVGEDGTTSIVEHPYLEGSKLGNYFKSIHYADEVLGEFFQELDEAGLLDNTAVIIYGDHDARLPKKDYVKMLNYDMATETVKDNDDPTYQEFNSYHYELNRKVPFLIWTKDGTIEPRVVDDVMGMYDVQPTISNMLGFYNKYALGHDIFEIKDQNIIVFPNGNWLTNKVYYNSQKGEYMSLKEEEVIDEDYIKKNSDYTEKLLDVSNNIIVFDLLNPNKDEQKVSKEEAK